ncbi:hypothetical protein CISECK367B_12545 [Citrobacter sedlakii]
MIEKEPPEGGFFLSPVTQNQYGSYFVVLRSDISLSPEFTPFLNR